jgi:hypothetical protein
MNNIPLKTACVLALLLASFSSFSQQPGWYLVHGPQQGPLDLWSTVTRTDKVVEDSTFIQHPSYQVPIERVKMRKNMQRSRPKGICTSPTPYLPGRKNFRMQKR